MIMRRRDGNTRRLTTTRRFSKHLAVHIPIWKSTEMVREQVSEAGLFDGMDSEALKDVGEDGLIQATLPLEEE